LSFFEKPVSNTLKARAMNRKKKDPKAGQRIKGEVSNEKENHAGRGSLSHYRVVSYRNVVLGPWEKTGQL
jgi:hypothetical protein